MKKFLKFLIVFLIIFTVSACAIDTPVPTDQTPPTTETPTPTPPTPENTPPLVPPSLNESFCIDNEGEVMIQTFDKYFVSGDEYTEHIFVMPVTIANPYNRTVSVRLSTAFCKVWIDIPALSEYVLTETDRRLKFGYVIARSDGYYTVNVTPTEYGSGYTVAPRTIDPGSKFDFAEVVQYVTDFPEYVVPGYV